MKATFLDLRRRMREILRALERSESVTILYRGEAKAILHPIHERDEHGTRAADHPAFGIWADRKGMGDVATFVRELRQGRARAL